MTHPTLLALLADPDPIVRAIAADWCAERGDEVSEAVLRADATCAAAVGWTWGAQGEADDWVVCLQMSDHMVRPAVHAISSGGGDGPKQLWILSLGSTWQCYDPIGSLAPANACPPHRLEAAVLAVLRRRLEEIAPFPRP